MTRLLFSRILFALWVAMLVCNVAVAATPAMSCHCFQDRQFSSEHPEAFDPYLLATVQNRLLAHVYQVPRKDVVKAKMGGETNAQLWTGYRLAALADVSLDRVMKSLADNGGSWPAVVSSLGLDPEQLGSPLMVGLLQGGAEEATYRLLTELLSSVFSVTPDGLDSMVIQKLTLQEMILAAVLASKVDVSMPVLLAERQRAPSWGAVLARYDLSIEQLEAHMVQQLSSAGR